MLCTQTVLSNNKKEMDTKEEIRKEYEDLSRKIDDLGDDMSDELKEKRDELRTRWEEAKDASDDMWESTKAEVRNGLDELKEKYDEARG